MSDLPPYTPPRSGKPPRLSLSSAIVIYILGLCIIWGDRFLMSGFAGSYNLSRVFLFFAGLPVAISLFVGVIHLAARRKEALVSASFGLRWGFATFGVLLLGITAFFWIERFFITVSDNPRSCPQLELHKYNC